MDTKDRARKLAADAMRRAKWTPHFIDAYERGEEEAPALTDLAERLVVAEYYT